MNLHSPARPRWLADIVPEYYKWPGYCSESKGLKFADIPNGLAALSKVPAAGWVQIFLFCGTVEKAVLVHDPTRPPGDFVNGGVLGVPNGSTMPPGDLRTRKLTSEIANGRLAMMAIIGMFYQDGLTGSAWGDWALYTDSPLRAFESEMGAMAPFGFWDPAGMCADGDVESYKRRRATELKHGRLSMFACLGYRKGCALCRRRPPRLSHLVAILEQFGAIMGPLGGILGPLGPSSAILGLS